MIHFSIQFTYLPVDGKTRVYDVFAHNAEEAHEALLRTLGAKEEDVVIVSITILEDL